MTAPTLDPEIFSEFLELLGTAPAIRWIETFLATLEPDPAIPSRMTPDRDEAFRTAHLIVGRAGVVGCLALVAVCNDLQHACKAGADLAGPCARMSKEMRKAKVALLQAMQSVRQT